MYDNRLSMCTRSNQKLRKETLGFILIWYKCVKEMDLDQTSSNSFTTEPFKNKKNKNK